MINKEEDKNSSEYYESEEEKLILITQEISSEKSSQDELDDPKDCDGICACSYKSINLISKDSKTPLNIFIHNYLPLINSIYFNFGILKINCLDILFMFPIMY